MSQTHSLWVSGSFVVGQAWWLLLELFSIGIGSIDTTRPWDWTYWRNPEAEGALRRAVTVVDQSHRLCATAVCWLLVATCRYLGWETPLTLGAEHFGHIERDLQGEEKCLSGTDNQWCRYPQSKMQWITFLPFQAYMDTVLLCFLFLQGRYQKCCLCGHQRHLFQSAGQHQPLRLSEAEQKSAEFCLAFRCHK